MDDFLENGRIIGCLDFLGFIKLDVDGSFIGNPGSIGFGRLLREWKDNWVLGFSGFAGYGPNLLLELLALKHGLLIAWN